MSACLNRVEGSAVTADDRRRTAFPGAAILERGCRFAPHRRIEDLAASGDRGLSVRGVNGLSVGDIAPDELAHCVARPCRHIRGFERAAQAVQGALGFSEQITQLRQLKALARDIADAHHRAAGHWAPVEFEMAAPQADDGSNEGFAAGQQPLRRLFDPGRLGRIEPRAEGEHARRQRRIGDEGEIALNGRLRVQTIPGDEDLRLAAQHQ